MHPPLPQILAHVVDPSHRESFDFADGWLYRSYGRLADRVEVEVFLRRLRNFLEPVWERRGQLRFLDVGSGFGFVAACLAALGARECYGVECVPGCLKTCQAIQKAFPDLPVEYLGGRAEALPLADASVDVVFVIEAISHFLKPWEFLKEALRVLTPGGLLLISDDNNHANPRHRRKLLDVWERFENGPVTQDVHGHRVRKPYVQARREILQAHLPQATPEELDLLSRRTSGLWGLSLVEAGRGYFERGDLPEATYRRGDCPIDPLSGAFMENLLSPFEIAARLRELGAGVRLLSYFGGESRGGIVRAVDRLVGRLVPSRWSMKVARGFRVYAEKSRVAVSVEREKSAV